MSQLTTSSKRLLVIVLVVLAAIASGVITWKIGDDHDDRANVSTPSMVNREQDLGVRPQLQWVLDTERLAGNPVDRALSFPYITDSAGIGPGSVGSAPGLLIAAVGHPLYGRYDTEDGRGIVVDSATLVGVDRATGDPLWRRPIGAVHQCSERYLRGTIACWSVDRVIFVDTATGRVRSEMATDFEMLYADVIDGVAYVSGRRTRGSVQSAVFTAGNVDAPTSLFTRTFDVRGHSPNIAEILPASNTFTVSESVYGPVQYRTTTYDLDTGVRRFTFEGNVRSAGPGIFRADDMARQRLYLLDRNGVALTRLRTTSWMVYPPRPRRPSRQRCSTVVCTTRGPVNSCGGTAYSTPVEYAHSLAR